MAGHGRLTDARPLRITNVSIFSARRVSFVTVVTNVLTTMSRRERKERAERASAVVAAIEHVASVPAYQEQWILSGDLAEVIKYEYRLDENFVLDATLVNRSFGVHYRYKTAKEGAGANGIFSNTTLWQTMEQMRCNPFSR